LSSSSSPPPQSSRGRRDFLYFDDGGGRWEDKLREEALGGISAATIFYILAFVCSPTQNIHKCFKRPQESRYLDPFSKKGNFNVLREKGGRRLKCPWVTLFLVTAISVKY